MDADTLSTNQDAIQQIVDAISQTAEWQYLRKKMEEDSAAAQVPEGTAVGPPQPGPEAIAPPQGGAAVKTTESVKVEGEDADKYAALDAMSDEDLAKYLACRKGKYQADDSSASTHQTAADRVGEGKEVVRDETSGPAAYQAEGSVDPDSDQPNTNATVIDSEETANKGTVSEQANYARNGHQESLQYQKLQLQVRTVSDENQQLRQQIEAEKGRRIDAERYQQVQSLKMQGFALDPDQEMERLNYSKMNDEQFNESIAAITQHYQRMPAVTLPLELTQADHNPAQPGNGQQTEKYSLQCSDMAMKICEKQLAEDPDCQPNFEEVLREVKEGKHGDVKIAVY